MKKRVKIILLVLAVIVVAALIAAASAFRPQPLIDADTDYLCPQMTLWLEGGNDAFEGRIILSPDSAQAAAITEVLRNYQCRLSTDYLIDSVISRFFPRHVAKVDNAVPPWLEVSFLLLDPASPDEIMPNFLVGNGHAQKRPEGTYAPPYYEVENSEQLYQELSAALDLPAMFAEHQQQDTPATTEPGDPTRAETSVLVDEALSEDGISWYQQEGYHIYRMWVENATDEEMTVTITGPTPRTFTLAAGAKEEIQQVPANSGLYQARFATASGTLQGTVKVEMSSQADEEGGTS